MINHSCDPNCVLMYRGGCVYVKALREIKEGEKRELEKDQNEKWVIFFKPNCLFSSSLSTPQEKKSLTAMLIWGHLSLFALHSSLLLISFLVLALVVVVLFPLWWGGR